MRDIQTAGRVLVLTAAAQFADNIIHCMTIVSENMSTRSSLKVKLTYKPPTISHH